MKTEENKKVVFISSISSDIGIALAKRYSGDGYTVSGTYRSRELLSEFEDLPHCHLFYCDLENLQSIRDAVSGYQALGYKWETFISCAAIPNPLTGFFQSDFDEWSMSVHVNAIEQLRILHAVYPYRRADMVASVVFFAGPGTNNAVNNFSALTVSKIMLIKFCELLDAENEDLNVFIVGPGWTKTKAHLRVLADPLVSPEKYNETLHFMENLPGTSMDDIYESIRWLSLKGRPVAGGRNFSIVHDYWGTEELAETLRNDFNMYKLRRYRNDWKDKEGKK